VNTLPPKTAADAANEAYRLPPKLFDARCAACWFMLGLAALTIASFWSLDLQWTKFLSADALRKMGRFLAELLTPSTDPAFLLKLAGAGLETIAMSALGTLLAATAGLALALPASRTHPGDLAYWRTPTRLLLNGLRAIPELVWALVFVRVVGLGPTAGVLAIALTYGGMLGKVYGEILESDETHATHALLRNGAGRLQAFFYGLLPQSAPELTSYTVYRWECAIRSSAVLGFVGAGGLGQQMDNSMKMFQGSEVATMLIAFMLLVAVADQASAWLRKMLA
jgi:phosphonate transport system permease protein